MAGTGHRAAADTTWLVGDIGATNARFGLVAPGGALLYTSTYASDDFATIDDAIRAFLDSRGELPGPRLGALAIAAAITGDRISMTNHPWSFSVTALRDRLGFERLVAINDFAAVAMAVPLLEKDDRLPIGGGAPVAHRTIAVLGPGSGLGTSGLVPMGPRENFEWVALSGEGGHATMAPASERESAVLDLMRARFDHVSAERVISGPGLVNLYTTLAALDGVPAMPYTPAQITDPEIGEQDALCREATAMFCAMLGTVAGNLALTLGAQGGVYIGGGIAPKLGSRLAASDFRERFEAKGRMRPYLAAIPTYIITHSLPAFLGCAAELAKPAR
ncbi:MAG: glucokinase [Alphaproteobacteria bacterium]